jgi:hypothetical protein
VIALDLPDAWNRASFTFSPPGGPTIDGVVATPDLEGWRQTYDVPGIFLGASEELAAQLHLNGDPFRDPSKITDWMVPIFDKVNAACSGNIGTDIFDSEGVYGYTDIYSNCDGASSVLVTVAASSDAKTVLLIEQVAPTDADLTAAEDTLASFSITEFQS